MATITPLMVKDLREKTGLPMMECKQALTECDGDIEAAKTAVNEAIRALDKAAEKKV